MAEASPLPEHPRDGEDDASELNVDLEEMIEGTENISVQLTWMAYDMVALRTSPELWASVRRLEEASHWCTVAVCGDRDQNQDHDRDHDRDQDRDREPEKS